MYLIEKYERKYGTTAVRLVILVVLALVATVLASFYLEYEAIKNGKYATQNNGMHINITNSAGESVQMDSFNEFSASSEASMDEIKANMEQMKADFENSTTRIETKTVINGKTIEHTIVE